MIKYLACKHCGWKAPPDSAMYPDCPECGKRMSWVVDTTTIEVRRRLAIAETDGWVPCEPKAFGFFPKPDHAFMKDGSYYGGLNAIPRYFEDHKEIRRLLIQNVVRKGLSSPYKDLLGIICRRHYREGEAYNDAVFASAAQHAEAYSKIMDIWIEDDTE